MPLSGILFHIHLFHTIRHNGKLQMWTTIETFRLFLHQNEIHFQSFFPQDSIILDYKTSPCAVINKNFHKKSWRIPASKTPYFEREVFWDNNSQKFWDQLPSPRILVLCGDEINTTFGYTEWNEKNKF